MMLVSDVRRARVCFILRPRLFNDDDEKKTIYKSNVIESVTARARPPKFIHFRMKNDRKLAMNLRALRRDAFSHIHLQSEINVFLRWVKNINKHHATWNIIEHYRRRYRSYTRDLIYTSVLISKQIFYDTHQTCPTSGIIFPQHLKVKFRKQIAQTQHREIACFCFYFSEALRLLTHCSRSTVDMIVFIRRARNEKSIVESNNAVCKHPHMLRILFVSSFFATRYCYPHCITTMRVFVRFIDF